MKRSCLGERYLGCGEREGSLQLEGTPGNALGAYLDGAEITVYGNAQDATGDTMNDGCITIHGSAGDAAGYAMRGGAIYIRDNAGYRAGIHMKAYQEKHPVLVIGGRCGAFLGEYQAGGTIVVLGIGCEETPVGGFCGTGMHGGEIFIRTNHPPQGLNLEVSKAEKEDLDRIAPLLEGYFQRFGRQALSDKPFYLLRPYSKNPYRRLYVSC